MDSQYWLDLAADYDTAAQRTGYGKTRRALLCAMAVAEHETNNGRAWPHTNNFGAVQLRRLTPEETQMFNAGTLKAGDTFASPDGVKPGGVLHVDTHPTTGGPLPYPVWFVYFGDDRVAGIAYFLNTLWRLSSGVLEQADAFALVEQMYLHGYFEGGHPGARPLSQRALPLTDPELANVSDYHGAVVACLREITAVLGDWSTLAVGDDNPYVVPGPPNL